MAKNIALTIDSSNEKVILGIGELRAETFDVEVIDEKLIDSMRASNQKLLPEIDELFKTHGLSAKDIAVVGVGRGPGSFTGVRIALATAKGICLALNVPLYGISTLDAIAENLRLNEVYGEALVVADAMRGEVYPVFYDICEGEIVRKNADSVAKPAAFLGSLEEQGNTIACGDGLVKHKALFEGKFNLLDAGLWYPSGTSMLSLLSKQMKESGNPLSVIEHDAGLILPVYTRLSDAEENELTKIKSNNAKDLVTGVQGEDTNHISVRPVELSDAPALAALEGDSFDSDAWSEASFTTDVVANNRIWLKAVSGDALAGYVGASYSGDTAEILKVCVASGSRKQGIGKKLMRSAFELLRNLGVSKVLLEVRESNLPAQALYFSLGFEKVCVRKGFYGNENGVTYSVDITNFANIEDFVVAESATFEDERRPLIFAIESSCDETAGAIVDSSCDVLSSVVSSSAKFHARFGGVVPEIASRKHIEVISQVAQETLRLANMQNYDDIDAIAVTTHPGLVGSLVVGQAFAKGVAWAANKPLVFIDHLEGHLFANKLCDGEIEMPCLASLISGGNTTLVLVKDWGDYEVVGGTIDDAVGEAFDKIARAMGLPYPGGPEISALSKDGVAANVELPRPLLHSHDLRMSLSGLKTAVVLEIERLKSENPDGHLTRQNMCDVCASFEQSICDVQVAKVKDAIKTYHAKTFCFGGGVAANRALRSAFASLCEKMHVKFCVAPNDVCGDNAVMIGLAAQFEFEQGNIGALDGDVSSQSPLNSRH
ncbi:MAG: tRNA (adenosine(37)-N6)-threonylcarbamoyltransferase complex transferase subunit TsaD [Phoenicibacter congonensis]|uniref:tRNA N6-adenosine threonylcarbamoyltransferase n=1 Tax=Phoenicibacter congonensis TaxID=1944646 RepID=A0AA43UB83_9ACTN|nr:tRNA (adenosine(37)-N6)-threonylcarbamoyltransferase complex transferase subunit TsaD [Phoenicibacter congonensis]